MEAIMEAYSCYGFDNENDDIVDTSNDEVLSYNEDPDYEHFIADRQKQSRGKAIWVHVDGIHENIVDIAMDFNTVHWIGGQQEIRKNYRTRWQGMIIWENRMYPYGISMTLEKIFQNTKARWGNLLTSNDISKMYAYIPKALTRDDQYSYEESDCLPAIYGDQKQKEAKEINVVQAMDLIAKHKGSMDSAMLEFIEGGGSTTQWAEAKTRYCMINKARAALKAKEDAKKQTLRPWQKHVAQILEGTPSKRDIIVVLDPVGNCGKTWFQKYWSSLFPDTTVAISNGKVADLSFIVQQKPFVNTILFNLTRSMQGIIAYQAIEQFKDGCYCTTKYQGREIKNESPHMVLFTNEPLNWEACSKDRWQIIEVYSDGMNFNQKNFGKRRPRQITEGGAEDQTSNNSNNTTIVKPQKTMAIPHSIERILAL